MPLPPFIAQVTSTPDPLKAAIEKADSLFQSNGESGDAPLGTQAGSGPQKPGHWDTRSADNQGFVLYTAKGKPVWVYGDAQPWSPELVLWETVLLIFMGVAAICTIGFLSRTEKNRLAVIRLVGIILIMIIAAMLVVCGFSDRQIATVIGLLGTIAGYLAGSRQASTEDQPAGVPRPPARE